METDFNKANYLLDNNLLLDCDLDFIEDLKNDLDFKKQDFKFNLFFLNVMEDEKDDEKDELNYDAEVNIFYMQQQMIKYFNHF